MPTQDMLNSLREKAEELNQLTDIAASEVKKVEDHLTVLHLGVEASVPVTGTSTRLVYHRIGDRFRIGVMLSDQTKPWSDCTREVKLVTFRYLDALLEEISKEADKKIVVAKGLRDPDKEPKQ